MQSLELAKQLIAQQSITPDDAACQQIIAKLLSNAGFVIEEHNFGAVKNMWAYHGNDAPTLMLLGHTDVVPIGNKDAWHSNPFTPTEKNGFLYGRGACDMKVAVAAMVVAAIEFVTQHPQHKGKLGILMTSDEEGDAIDGTQKVVAELVRQQQKIDYCLIGEPTSDSKLADTIKNGRRGSISAKLKIIGKQGHIAYPSLADNPIHKALPLLNELVAIEWDKGYKNFPPTSLQISNVHAGTGAGNVIPQDITIDFNLRYSPAIDAQHIQQTILELLDAHGINYKITWRHSAKPFASPDGKLLDASLYAVENTLGYKPVISTSGGTSDGRFVAPTGAEIIELGLLNATAHKVNEAIEIAHVAPLTDIYKKIITRLL